MTADATQGPPADVRLDIRFAELPIPPTAAELAARFSGLDTGLAVAGLGLGIELGLTHTLSAGMTGMGMGGDEETFSLAWVRRELASESPIRIQQLTLASPMLIIAIASAVQGSLLAAPLVASRFAEMWKQIQRNKVEIDVLKGAAKAMFENRPADQQRMEGFLTRLRGQAKSDFSNTLNQIENVETQELKPDTPDEGEPPTQ